MTTIIRRRKLGFTSVKGIVEHSDTGIKWSRSDQYIPEDDMFIRWGCTCNLPGDPIVVNSAKAIHRVADKRGFREILEEHELCPKTWFNQEVPNDVDNVILRTRTHHQGKGLWVFDSKSLDLSIKMRELGVDGFYVSEIIDKVAEYRVFVVQGRAICVAQKTPGNPDDVAWNVAKGGRFDNVRWNIWPLKAVRMSIEAFSLSGLDFGGVDVMVDKEGECYVLEINSAPSLTSPYRQQCFAKAFDYIAENGAKPIPLVEERGGYLKFIHPAINNRAKLKGGR